MLIDWILSSDLYILHKYFILNMLIYTISLSCKWSTKVYLIEKAVVTIICDQMDLLTHLKYFLSLFKIYILCKWKNWFAWKKQAVSINHGHKCTIKSHCYYLSLCSSYEEKIWCGYLKLLYLVYILHNI